MTAPDPSPRVVSVVTTVKPLRRPWGRLRGTLAVTWLLLTAAGHLAAAALGIRPDRARALAAPIAATWRSASRRPASPRSGGAPVIVVSPASEKES